MMHGMKCFIRLILSVTLLAVSGFCLFGFVATFEPLPPVQQWIWRTVYCLVPALCMWAIVRIWRPAHPKNPSQIVPVQKL